MEFKVLIKNYIKISNYFTTNKKRSLIIDLWRGVAILMVMWHHWFFFDGCATPKYGVGLYYDLIHSFLGSGWIGVDIFFFLSGFLLWQSMFRLDGPGGAKEFLLSRAKRLLPLYYISAAMALFFTSGLAVGSKDFFEWIFRYLWVGYVFDVKTLQPIGNWVLWSLGVEIWISLIFPALYLMLRKNTVAVLICFIIFSLLWRMPFLGSNFPSLSRACHQSIPERLKGLLSLMPARPSLLPGG